MEASRAAVAQNCPTPGGLGESSSCGMHPMPGNKQHPQNSNHLHERRLQHGIVKGVTVCRWKSGGLHHRRQAPPQHTAGQSAACSRSHGRQQLRGSLPRRQGEEHVSQLSVGCSCFSGGPAEAGGRSGSGGRRHQRRRHRQRRCGRGGAVRLLAHVAPARSPLGGAGGGPRPQPTRTCSQEGSQPPGAGSEACARVIGAESVGFRRRCPRCTGSCCRRCRCAGMESRRAPTWTTPSELA